jgi:RNA polymerase sigma-70 factor (ECF subfamily)
VILQNLPELQIRDRILRGDREAAETLFRQVFDGLYEFTYYRVGCNRDLAETVVQDTLTTAYATLGHFEGRSTIQTWLCGIAKNKIREHRRRRRVRSIEDILDESSLEIDAILSKVEREPIPDEVLQLKETKDLVGATLSSLPTNYRDVLIAKYVDELPVNEIAERTHKSPKATESLLTRARVAFARVFELLAKRRGEELP